MDLHLKIIIATWICLACSNCANPSGGFSKVDKANQDVFVNFSKTAKFTKKYITVTNNLLIMLTQESRIQNPSILKELLLIP